MSKSTLGSCSVCGRETKTRCQACGKAGIDLFFCSSEHQKLVWFAHKEVCGPGKANPLVWPDFSQAEADEACKHIDTPFPWGEKELVSLASQLQKTFPKLKLRNQRLSHLLQTLTTNAKDRFPGSLAHRQILLREVRTYEAARMRITRSTLLPKSTQVIQLASNAYNALTKDASPPIPQLDTSWVPPLIHRLVFFYTLKFLALSDPNLAPLVIETQKQLEKVIFGQVKKEAPPGVAQDMPVTYLQLFCVGPILSQMGLPVGGGSEEENGMAWL